MWTSLRHPATAGHCTGLDTYTWMPRYDDIVGVVRKDGWKNGTGSVEIDGQSYNAGDVSLVQLCYPFASGYSVYVGGTLGRNLAYAKKTGTCAAEGDSGGGKYNSTRTLFFSDIRVAEKSFPGAVKHI